MERETKTLIIDERARLTIKEIAHRLLVDGRFEGPVDITAIKFKALEDYLLRHGLTPSFTVKL